MAREFEVPFNEEGHMLSDEWYGVTEKRKNYTFQDELEYVSFSRGRSAVDITLVSCRDNVRYHMRMQEFSKMVPHMVKGKIRGTFTFNKRGANYSLVYVQEEG